MESNNILGTFLSIVYSVLLLQILQFIIFRKINKSINIVFLFYVFLAICYFIANIIVIPEFKGFTGGFKIGTDDLKYFLQIKDDSVKGWSNLVYGRISETHSFSKFLKTIYPFPIYSPLQIITFNCLGITLIPFLGKKIYLDYFPNEKHQAKIIFILLLLSPSLLMNGLILMRDGWTAQIFLIFVFVLKCSTSRFKILYLILITFILIYLRPSFGIFPLLFMYIDYFFTKKFFAIRTVLVLLVAIPLAYLATFYLDNTEFGREQYIEGFLSNFEGESLFYKIMTLPFPLNFIFSFVFFLASPFLNFNFFYENTFIIRNLFNVAEAIIMLILLPVAFKNVFSNKNLNSKKLLLYVILSIFILATMSLQFRHKIVILPFLYMLLINNIKKSYTNIFLILAYTVIQLLIVLK